MARKTENVQPAWKGFEGKGKTVILKGARKRGVCDPCSLSFLLPSCSTLFFSWQVYILKKEEGGRHKPFVTNYQPQMYVRTGDVAATITLPEGKEFIMPGDDATFTIKLMFDIAIEQGLRFTLREGSRTVGTGVVTKIIE